MEVSPYVVDWVSGVATQGKQLLTEERGDVADETLEDRHCEGGGNKANPVLIDERQRVCSELPYQAGRNTHAQQESRECFVND